MAGSSDIRDYNNTFGSIWSMVLKQKSVSVCAFFLRFRLSLGQNAHLVMLWQIVSSIYSIYIICGSSRLIIFLCSPAFPNMSTSHYVFLTANVLDHLLLKWCTCHKIRSRSSFRSSACHDAGVSERQCRQCTEPPTFLTPASLFL